MKVIRNHFAETFTEGKLHSEHIDRDIFTLERPWFRDPLKPGGLNNVSCVPNGTYELSGFMRPSGDEVPHLVNTQLGVYRFKTSVPPKGGRYLILIHPGNFIKDIIGCIAPGFSRSTGVVNTSRLAYEMIWDAFLADDRELIISSFDTSEKNLS